MGNYYSNEDNFRALNNQKAFSKEYKNNSSLVVQYISENNTAIPLQLGILTDREKQKRLQIEPQLSNIVVKCQQASESLVKMNEKFNEENRNENELTQTISTAKVENNQRKILIYESKKCQEYLKNTRNIDSFLKDIVYLQLFKGRGNSFIPLVEQYIPSNKCSEQIKNNVYKDVVTITSWNQHSGMFYQFQIYNYLEIEQKQLIHEELTLMEKINESEEQSICKLFCSYVELKILQKPIEQLLLEEMNPELNEEENDVEQNQVLKLRHRKKRNLWQKLQVILIIEDGRCTMEDLLIVGRQFIETEILAVIQPLLKALNNLQQDFHISHCDIKPENLILDSDLTSYKLGNFSPTSIQMEQWNDTQEIQFIGSPAYMSPILHENFNLIQLSTNNFENINPAAINEIKHNPFKSDVFSIGLLILRMMGQTWQSFYETIRKHDECQQYLLLKYQNAYPTLIPILRKMLIQNEEQRISFNEALQLVNEAIIKVGIRNFKETPFIRKLPPFHKNKMTQIQKYEHFKQLFFIYQELNMHNETLHYAQKSLQIANQPSQIAFSNLIIGQQKLYKKQFKEAQNYLETSVEFCQNLYSEYDRKTCVALILLATTYDILGEKQKALGSYARVLKIKYQIKDQNYFETVRVLGNLAQLYNKMGDIQKSILHYEECIRLKVKLKEGANDIIIAIALNNLGSLYNNQGQFDKAIQCHREALKIKRHCIQEETNTMAYDSIGQYEKAIKYYQQCIEIKSVLFGDTNYKLANLYLNLGGCYFELKNYQAAINCHQESLKIEELNVGPHHPKLALALFNLGEIYNEMGDKNNSLYHYEESYRLNQKADLLAKINELKCK